MDYWTRAWQWSCLNKDIIHTRSLYCMPVGEEKKLTTRDVNKYFNIVDQLSWSKFDEYANQINTLHYVKFNKEDWIRSKCNCWFYAKNYYCNHIIGLAVHKKRVVFKDIHKQIQIGQSRKRGQPKKTASALVKQTDYSSSSESSSESGSTSASEDSPVKPSTSRKPKSSTPKKIHKKRGPKPKTVLRKLTPKKRGRKPKN